MSTTNIYPGMETQNEIEFYTNSENYVKYISEGKVNCISNLPKDVKKIILEKIDSKLDVAIELNRLYKSNDQKIAKFLSCQYGNLDFNADMVNGELKDPEFTECPLRGKCASEGVLCNSFKYYGSYFSSKEIKLWKLCTTEMTNEAIAEELNLCMGTFHKIKKELYRKLDSQTKQRLTIKAFKAGLI